MKRNLLILLGVFFYLSSYSQDSLIIVERKINQYYFDTLYCQIDFSFTNKSVNNYVLWIENNDVSSLSESERIRNYFFVRKGDFSLMELIWDGNIGYYIPKLFSTFMKIINSKEQFVVSILVKGDVHTQSEKINLLESQIQIVESEKIKGLTIDSLSDFFNYKSNNITVLYEWLNI